MADPVFDIVVIGGGIHGVGVAQAAAAAGYSVLVLEQTALAYGTSSRSSKLIHGGLRYLEYANFSLVRESLQERNLLLNLAPGLVRQVPFHIPVYKESSRRSWKILCGLMLYSALSGFRRNTRFARIPKSSWDDLDGLTLDGLNAMYRYSDCQTDDVALTKAVMDSALVLGAKLAMPASLNGAMLNNGEWEIHFTQNNRKETRHAHTIVNAAGPWVNHVSRRIEPQPKMEDIELVQGAHIIVKDILTQGIYYVEAPSDHRPVFIMPWKGNTLVGTTETAFSGNPTHVQITGEEEAYLLDTLKYYFPKYSQNGYTEVLDRFAGLRVLPAGKKHFYARTRETILSADRKNRPRALTIYGGKLTTYRRTAESVLKRLLPSLPKRKPVADTKTLPLLTAF